MMAPSLPTLVWQHWQPDGGVDAVAAAAALAYLLAARRTRRWPRRRMVSFLAGLGCVVVSLQSGLGTFDDRMLSDHMIQHLLLLEVAPLLLLGGRPVILALRSVPRARRPVIAGRVRWLAPLSQPLLCLAIFYAVVLATHLPAFYDATPRDGAVHELEHGLYLTAGVFVWWPLLDGDPIVAHRLNGLGRLTYMIAAMLPMTLIGAYLYRDPTPLYPVYVAPARALGISAVTDQALGGAIMWVLGSCVVVAWGLWQVMAALIAEERRMQLRERSAAAMVTTHPGSRQ